MNNTSRSNLGYVLLSIAIIVSLAGCSPGYVITKAPSMDVRLFKNVEVAKVQIRTTETELPSYIGMLLREAMVDEIIKKQLYHKVSTELDEGESILRIEPTISEFDEGSRAARALIGLGVGKGKFKVKCIFIDKERNQAVAEGAFASEVSGGVWGGEVDAKQMTIIVAEQVANFLSRNK